MQNIQQPETALEKLHREWLSRGAQRPPKPVLRADVERYEKARTQREKLEAKIAALKDSEREAAEAIVAKCGKGRFVLNGKSYQASSRGEVIYLKKYQAPIELS